MASRTGKIQSAWTATGAMLYAIVRNAIAEAWNVGGATFEAFNVANWSQYAVPMTEQGALSQFYVADLPAGAESYYTFTVYEQVGVGPAVGDTLVEVVRATQLADDVPHGGTPGASRATIACQQINSTNPTAAAVVAHCTGNDSSGIDVLGNGIGAGVSVQGGASNADGVDIFAGGTGNGLYISGLSALICDSSGPNSIGATFNGTFAGLLVQNTNFGAGAIIKGRDNAGSDGPGLLVVGALSSPAVQLGDGLSGAAGLLIQAGANDHAVHIIGGSTAGNGILIESLGHGIDIQAVGGGISIISDGTGIGVQSNTDSAIFLAASALATVAFSTGVSDAVSVNLTQSVDGLGRHRILSSLTIGEDLLAFPFVMADLAGNPKTGLTVTSTVSRDGAAAVPTANSATEVGNGQYSIDLTASDRAATTMMLRFTAPNARDLDIALINTA